MTDPRGKRNEHGVNVGHFAHVVNRWAAEQSELRGRDVSFAEALTRWCQYVHPDGDLFAARFIEDVAP